MPKYSVLGIDIKFEKAMPYFVVMPIEQQCLKAGVHPYHFLTGLQAWGNTTKYAEDYVYFYTSEANKSDPKKSHQKGFQFNTMIWADQRLGVARRVRSWGSTGNVRGDLIEDRERSRIEFVLLPNIELPTYNGVEV